MKFRLLSTVAVLAVAGLAFVHQVKPVLAASASLTALDPDNDGTLDAKELSGRVDEAGLKSADPDSDGTLDQKEYDILVETRFKAADPDNDGTLDDAELTTDAGKSFLLLVE